MTTLSAPLDPLHHDSGHVMTPKSSTSWVIGAFLCVVVAMVAVVLFANSGSARSDRSQLQADVDLFSRTIDNVILEAARGKTISTSVKTTHSSVLSQFPDAYSRWTWIKLNADETVWSTSVWRKNVGTPVVMLQAQRAASGGGVEYFQLSSNATWEIVSTPHEFAGGAFVLQPAGVTAPAIVHSGPRVDDQGATIGAGHSEPPVPQPSITPPASQTTGAGQMSNNQPR